MGGKELGGTGKNSFDICYGDLDRTFRRIKSEPTFRYFPVQILIMLLRVFYAGKTGGGGGGVENIVGQILNWMKGGKT